MVGKIEKKQQTILKVLREADKSLSGAKIAKELEVLGYDISQRTVRYYLKKMDRDGFTKNIKKHGRQITEHGLKELDATTIIERVGFLSEKIDQMSYRMNFDLDTKSGTVVINVTMVEPKKLFKYIHMICRVFDDGYAMGYLVTLLGPGERAGHITVPDGMVGIGTVCSFTLNGVLLKYGVPANSKFGGLLEFEEGKSARFVEIINYDGTSIDPLEIFIRSGMTNYFSTEKSLEVRVGASFREFPAESRDLVKKLDRRLKEIGLGGFFRIGRPGQALLEIPLSGEGRVGAIAIGGLNPVATLEKTEAPVYSRALAGLIDFNRLFHYDELHSRLKQYL
ncbi:MAG: DUF128 domain-containing protein [Deltaproteobacteria bacterium]|nr:DUF128 domain-containing protein [Deltaproteobacteria bacterium]